MHTPTLVVVAAILSALVTAVLFVVWLFNRRIPGLQQWTWAFCGASVFCITLLLREHLPEAVSVTLSQSANMVAGYLCWQGSRAYMGRSLWPYRYAAMVLAGVLGVALYFTVVAPHPGARFALAGTVAAVCFLLTARTVARGGFRKVPARYVFAGMVGVHGLFVLARPLLFRLAAPSDEGLLVQVSQFVLLEATVALVMIACSSGRCSWLRPISSSCTRGERRASSRK